MELDDEENRSSAIMEDTLMIIENSNSTSTGDGRQKGSPMEEECRSAYPSRRKSRVEEDDYDDDYDTVYEDPTELHTRPICSRHRVHSAVYNPENLFYYPEEDDYYCERDQPQPYSEQYHGDISLLNPVQDPYAQPLQCGPAGLHRKRRNGNKPRKMRSMQHYGYYVA